MMVLTYKIPSDLLGAVNSGRAELFGAIIKDQASGQILGHVQQTSHLSGMINQALGVGGQFASGGFSLLDAVSVVQNEQIKNRISALQEGMILMQNLQYGTLALSGLGLGVSIVGFALVHTRLKKIEGKLERISEQIEKVTHDRRMDELQNLFSEIQSDLRQIESLPKFREPQGLALHSVHSLSRNYHKVLMIFEGELKSARQSLIPIEKLGYFWELAATVRVCQEALIRALFAANELEVAEHYGQEELRRMMVLLSVLNPNALSRLIAGSETNIETGQKLRREAHSQAQLLVNGIRGGVLALASQVSISQCIRNRNITGIEYLKKVAEGHAEAPFLFIDSRSWWQRHGWRR